jgi:hypothetical protein
MIGVKGIRASQAKPNETDRYEVTGLTSVSRIPAVLAALTGAVALYLKSFLPVWADTPAPSLLLIKGLVCKAAASHSSASAAACCNGSAWERTPAPRGQR